MAARRALAALLAAGLILATGGNGAMAENPKKATFGAGCFWGVEKIFAKVPGVRATAVGYTGGMTNDPDYHEVCTGRTGHVEAVEVTYDPAKVGYEELLAVFWEWHDPTTPDQQGPDIGPQYRSVIFFHDEGQREAARRSKELLEKAKIFPGRIVTQIVPASEFYRAEEYHQKYLQKNPTGYCSHFLRPETDKIREALKLKRAGPAAKRP